MMKYLFSFIIFFSCVSVFAQKNSSFARSKGILIGFNFSPDYDYRKLKNNGGDSFIDQVIKTRNEMEKAKFSYTTGVNFGVRITKMFGIEAGLQYSNKGFQTKKEDLFYPQPDPAYPVKAKFIYNYHYIDVPLKVNLVAGKNKIHFISSAGFSVNFLIKNKRKDIYEYADGQTKRMNYTPTYNLKKINISPLVSAGAECRIKKEMYVRIEPTLRYSVLTTADLPIKEYLWNVGLNIGFYYRL